MLGKRALGFSMLALLAASLTASSFAAAQYPPPQPQPQPYPPQGYPPQPQPYPPQPQPYPPQPYPPQPGQPYPGQPYPPPPPQQASDKRSDGEMAYLYGTSIGFGIGTGVWIDALGKTADPGIAFIAPLAFGAAMPLGVYLWDNNSTMHRGVPSSIATGLLVGGLEGIAISGLQWQGTAGNQGAPIFSGRDNTWSFATQTTVTFLTATAGGVGGYLFGEALRPDPRSLTFIMSGAAWGAISGTLIGAGVTPQRPADVARASWGDYASVAGFVGLNVGLVGTGALSLVYTPSYKAQKYMWTGFAIGTVAASFVYVFYLFAGDNAPVWHGLIANGVGGLAGVGIAAALAGNVADDDTSNQRRAFAPPFHIGVSQTPHGGMMLNAVGTF